MNIEIGDNGLITSIGYMPYRYLCPPFITWDNFTQYRCINREDIMNEASWEVIEQVDNTLT